MSQQRLHVTFGQSAAHSLRLALKRLNVLEEVAPLIDDFTMGPLDPGDAEQRAAWEREELYDDDPIATSEDTLEFANRISNWPGRLIVWMSSRSARELCGLHELLWRLPNANLHLIDVATVEFGPTSPYDDGRDFAIMRDERIVELGLIDTAKPVGDVARASYRNRWQQLREENAPLRVLNDNGLVSVPIDYFDERLRRLVTDDWQLGARIVGNLLGDLSRGRYREFSSDIFLFERLFRLLDTDELEGQPDANGLYSGRSNFRRRHPSPEKRN